MNKYNFYFLHATTYKNLKKILKSGYISAKNNTDIQFGSGQDIYFSVYFDDIENIDRTFQYNLLLSPKIVNDYEVHFNKGWGFKRDFVIINKNDNQVNKKLETIHNYLKNPDLPNNLMKSLKITYHELFVEQDIPLEKYLIGLICYCDNVVYEKIKRLLSKLKLNHIKVFNTNIPPSYDDIVKNEIFKIYQGKKVTKNSTQNNSTVPNGIFYFKLQ